MPAETSRLSGPQIASPIKGWGYPPRAICEIVRPVLASRMICLMLNGEVSRRALNFAAPPLSGAKFAGMTGIEEAKNAHAANRGWWAILENPPTS